MASNQTASYLWVFLIFIMAASIGLTASQFVLEPFDVNGMVGRNVTLYCQVDVSGNNDIDVYWGLPNVGAIGPNRNRNSNYPRHSFTGNPERGYYNLRITDVKTDDTGEYTCIYTRTTPDEIVTDEVIVMLTVLDEGKDTTTVCGGFEGMSFVYNATDSPMIPPFTCSATGGIPLAGGGDVKWYLVLRDNTLVDIPGIITVEPNSVTSTIDSSKTILTGEEDNSYLRCATGPFDKAPFHDIPPGASEDSNSEDRFRVMYEPLVRILPSEIKVGMFETFDLEIKCLADGNPPLSDHPVFDFDSGIENLTSPRNGNDSNIVNRLFTRSKISITVGDVGKTINCTAVNELGTTTLTVEIRSLGGLPTWLICALILIGGIVLFLVVLFYIICCCKCDLEQERKRTERRRRTLRDGKVNGTGNLVQSDDELGDIDLHTYDQAPPVMMPESPQDSGNYPDSDSGSTAMVNDFRIEEPEGDGRRISIGSGSEEGGVSNNVYEDDEDGDLKKKQEYLQVTIADDTEGEDLQLDNLSRDTSPSLNELN